MRSGGSLCSNFPDIMDSLRVTIVGGGAAAVIAARHLLTTATGPVDLRIVEKDDGIGPGLAYRTTHALHTLNNFAGRLSAVPGDPDHLLRWCARRGVPADPRSFLPRKLYGAYLAETLTDLDVPTGGSLTLTQGVVTDLVPAEHGHTVVTDDGRRIEADVVVLALGNPPPRRRPDLEILRERYVADPWAPGLDERAAEAEAILLIGTGLTTVDVAASLHDDHPQLTFTAVSRTLLVPQRHRRSTLHPHDAFHPGTTDLDGLVAAVDGRIAEVAEVGGDWRDVVDAVRGYANELWQGLSAQDQQRFATGLSRRWDTHRHRMAPEMAACIDGMRAAGALELAPADSVDPTTYDLVVNCSGPAPVHTPGWNPLVDRLLSRGLLSAHALGLGLDLDDAGRPRDTAGVVREGIHVLGAARKGLEWEVTAIPDLRAQAVRLADHLAARRVAPPRGQVVPA